jgi:hypothetical protein
MTRAPVQTYNEKFTVSLQKVDGSPPPTLKQSERSGVAWRRYPRGDGTYPAGATPTILRPGLVGLGSLTSVE